MKMTVKTHYMHCTSDLKDAVILKLLINPRSLPNTTDVFLVPRAVHLKNHQNPSTNSGLLRHTNIQTDPISKPRSMRGIITIYLPNDGYNYTIRLRFDGRSTAFIKGH